tara:strand:+ start:879 stop:1187 length:309 start_codon:yes stop_codon:yes gene_type:complete
MEKVQKIADKINHLKRNLRVKMKDEQDIEYGDFDIMSKYFPKLRREIMNTNESISYDFATTIGQLLTDDLTLSKWIILKEFIEGRNKEYDVMGSFDENGDLI